MENCTGIIANEKFCGYIFYLVGSQWITKLCLTLGPKGTRHLVDSVVQELKEFAHEASKAD